MRRGAPSLIVAMALGGALVSLWSRAGHADMFCGGGHPPEPAPSASASADAGVDGSAAPGADPAGPTGLNERPAGYDQRPCMSGSPWSQPSTTDYGMLAGMVLLGGGAAAASRKKAPEKKA